MTRVLPFSVLSFETPSFGKLSYVISRDQGAQQHFHFCKSKKNEERNRGRTWGLGGWSTWSAVTSQQPHRSTSRAGWLRENPTFFLLLAWMGAQYYDAKWVRKAGAPWKLWVGLRRPPSTVPPRVRLFGKEARGTNTDRTVYVRGGVGERLLLCRPPHAAGSPWRRWRATPRTSTSRRAIRVPTGTIPLAGRAKWVNDVKNKQAADVLLSLAPVGGAHAA